MTKPFIGAPPSRSIADGKHSDILAVLPEYVMIHVLGQQPPPEWRAFEQHLAVCPTCRGEADDLMQLMMASYTGAVPEVLAPPPDLSFLPRRGRQETRAKQTGIHTQSPPPASLPIVLQFSAALLPSMHVRMAARSGNTRLRYLYERPAADHEPAITVEVYEADDAPNRGRVRVCVELPDRSPFDQAGTVVTLQVDDARWEASTGEDGHATFAAIPLDAIERWRFTVRPPDTEPT